MTSVLPNGVVITLDVGGTAVKSALIAVNGHLIDQPRTTLIDCQASADSLFGRLVDIIGRHMEVQTINDEQLHGIAVGFPGPFEYDTGICRIEGLAKFDSIYGLNVRKELQQRLGMANLPIRFRNDAEAAIVGEALYGAGSTFTRLIGITLGTGLGSAFLVDGRPMTTGKGIPDNGWLHCIPFQGLQAYDVFSTRTLISSLQAEGLEIGDIEAAAAQGRDNDSAVQQIFARYGHELSTFLYPYVEAFQAEALFVQGGISNAFDLFQ